MACGLEVFPLVHLSHCQSNHLLTLLALLSLFTFIGIGDKQNQGLWLSLRIVGCGAALSAAYGYCKEEEDTQTTDENTCLLDAVSEIKEGYEWQQYTHQG
ncbi:MAG TPA: hypothetical protein V6C78_31870 [Crinalium sp.]|jgi:hypothetical protein